MKLQDNYIFWDQKGKTVNLALVQKCKWRLKISIGILDQESPFLKGPVYFLIPNIKCGGFYSDMRMLK